ALSTTGGLSLPDRLLPRLHEDVAAVDVELHAAADAWRNTEALHQYPRSLVRLAGDLAPHDPLPVPLRQRHALHRGAAQAVGPIVRLLKETLLKPAQFLSHHSPSLSASSSLIHSAMHLMMRSLSTSVGGRSPVFVCT